MRLGSAGLEGWSLAFTTVSALASLESLDFRGIDSIYAAGIRVIALGRAPGRPLSKAPSARYGSTQGLLEALQAAAA
jgi:hypothetical protein